MSWLPLSKAAALLEEVGQGLAASPVTMAGGHVLTPMNCSGTGALHSERGRPRAVQQAESASTGGPAFQTVSSAVLPTCTMFGCRRRAIRPHSCRQAGQQASASGHHNADQLIPALRIECRSSMHAAGWARCSGATNAARQAAHLLQAGRDGVGDCVQGVAVCRL